MEGLKKSYLEEIASREGLIDEAELMVCPEAYKKINDGKCLRWIRCIDAEGHRTTSVLHNV